MRGLSLKCGCYIDSSGIFTDMHLVACIQLEMGQ